MTRKTIKTIVLFIIGPPPAILIIHLFFSSYLGLDLDTNSTELNAQNLWGLGEYTELAVATISGIIVVLWLLVMEPVAEKIATFYCKNKY